MIQIPDIEVLIADRLLFNAFIYTPINDAVRMLEERSGDESLEETVKNNLSVEIPSVLQKSSCAFLSRHVATPNYETRRFINLVEATQKLTPVLGEYIDDKFVSNNVLKHGLGRLGFYQGRDREGNMKTEFCNCIDFNASNGKKISEIKTLWGQSLVDFHHEFFTKTYLAHDTMFFDASGWYLKAGGNAINYYHNLLLLFVRNGILFENFMLDKKELLFTKEIFLPAFIKIVQETGVKPLIVALEPTEIEGDIFWNCYPPESMSFIKDKLHLI